MNVFAIGSYQPSSLIKTSTKSTEKHLFSLSATQKKTEVEYKPDQASEIWGELAGAYDIRNATFDELCEISLKLYEEGQISLKDHGILTFNPSKSPQTPGLTINLTPASPEGRMDWIAEYEARLKRDLEINNLLGYANNQKIVQILKCLDR